MEESEKVRENRLRRAADRQGRQLQKSRARDPRALGFGLWRIVDSRRNRVVAGGQPWDYSLTLDDVEAWLVGEQ